MIVTIIGSFKRKNEMLEAKEYFESFGHEVKCPYDEKLQKLSLLKIQSTWIKAIEAADLIVAIPKSVFGGENGDSKCVLEFGESTSYEMAIAQRFNKRVMIW